ncbi:MAG: hypothetical protein LC804_19695 [Acidobacteria bacterium]|nr:hypothetical protein [Acidobacteriota bacterium]
MSVLSLRLPPERHAGFESPGLRARILIVSEYDDQQWRAAAGQAGACGYVLKEDLLEVGALQTPD